MREVHKLSVATLVLALSPVAWADYAETVLQDNPVAYYRFEEPEGSEEIADSSGNDYEGFEVLEVEFEHPGVADSLAAEFFGISSIVLDLTMNPDDPEGDGAGNGNDDFTIETWMYTTSDRNQQVFVAQSDGINGLGRSDMLISLNLELGSYIGGGTRDSGFAPELETWYHFVMTVDGTNDELYFYVNGEPSEDNPLIPANGIESATGEWVIGSHKNQAMQFFEGLLDEIAFYDYRLDDPDGDDDTADSRIAAHYAASGMSTSVPGDFDGDGLLTAADIDRLSTAVRDGLTDAQFDLNADGDVNDGDRAFWVGDLKQTWFGDSDLNLLFDTGDMVQVFVNGKYETGEESGWEDGDWNGDGRFSSDDMVTAFIGGGYEAGGLPGAGAVQAVPEPATATLLLLGLLGIAACRRSR